MLTEKVGMKELDRRLGEILAKAQERPVIVYRWRAPWLCIVPDTIWERNNPWGSLLPPDHPLVVLRANLDARLGRDPVLLSSVGNIAHSLFPADVLIRVLAFKALRDIRCEEYLCDQITFNMVYRWFVGLSPDCQHVEQAVHLAWQLGLRPGTAVSTASLLTGLSADVSCESWQACQRTLFGNESPQHFAA